MDSFRLSGRGSVPASRWTVSPDHAETGGTCHAAMTDTPGRKTTVHTAWPEGQTMWNDTELQHDIENEVGWELSAALTQISVTVKSGAVELGGHVDSFWEKCAAVTNVLAIHYVYDLPGVNR